MPNPIIASDKLAAKTFADLLAEGIARHEADMPHQRVTCDGNVITVTEYGCGSYTLTVTAHNIIADLRRRLAAAEATPPELPADERIAALENAVRVLDFRLASVCEALADLARRDDLHASVRILADTIALNLASVPSEVPRG